jgi:hypothetical protein
MVAKTRQYSGPFIIPKRLFPTIYHDNEKVFRKEPTRTTEYR